MWITELVRSEARRAQIDIPAITVCDLLQATLRHRPDRMLVGSRAGAFLQALKTGTRGRLDLSRQCGEQTLRRFTSCGLQAPTCRIGDLAMRSPSARNSAYIWNGGRTARW